MTAVEVSVEDVSGVVNHVLSLKPTGQFWFRGMGCSQRHLVPSLLRRMEVQNPAGVTPIGVLEMERRLITRFRQRSLPYWPDGYPQKDWEHLFAMQHYGVPTRLLDWTVNLLVAVFFAIDHDPASCECGTGACVPTVWILDPILLNRSNPRLDGLNTGVFATSDKLIEQWSPGTDGTLLAPAPISLYGTYNSDRIAAQSGSFTVAGSSLLSLDAEPAVAATGGLLTKVLLAGGPELLGKQLALMGVTRSSVYPGLAELARDIANEEIGA